MIDVDNHPTACWYEPADWHPGAAFFRTAGGNLTTDSDVCSGNLDPAGFRLASLANRSRNSEPARLCICAKLSLVHGLRRKLA